MAAAVALGLVCRLAFALGYWQHQPLTHDEVEYLALAQNVAAGRGFTYDPPAEGVDTTPQRFGRAPLYPVFLALVTGGRPLGREASGVPASVKVAQSLAGAASVWLIGLIAWWAAGSRTAVAATFLAAVYPPLVWICAYALSEAVYSVLALGSALLLGLAVDRPTARDGKLTGWLVAVAGLVAGLAALTRPAMLLFLVLAGLWLVGQRRLTLAAALLGGAALVVGPWTARNVWVHHRFVLVASEGGVTFWTGNHPLARGEGDMAANPEIKRANIAFLERHPGLEPEELEPLYYREARTYIQEHPVQWIWLLARKLFYLAVPIGPSYTLHSTRYLVASWVSYGSILPFAVLGFLALRREASQPHALWLLAASAVLVCLVFFPQERFRIPVLDPTLIVCAAAWWGLRSRTR